MCGIIAMWGENTPQNIRLLERMLVQASYRGTHATGIAWVDESKNEIQTWKYKMNATEFLQKYNLQVLLKGNKRLRVIAHTRYVTSGGEDMPLGNKDYALAMNGVLSQDEPKNWPRLIEDIEYTTGNDAEIFQQYSAQDKLGKLVGSFASCELFKQGSGWVLRLVRSGFRPLYSAKVEGVKIAASTKDILLRSGVLQHEMVPPIGEEFQGECSYGDLKTEVVVC